MDLLDLPAEILLKIADHTPQAALNALIQTNPGVFNLLEDRLYRKNVQEHDGNALLWASLHGRENTVRKLLNANADVNVNTQPIKEDLSRHYMTTEKYTKWIGQIMREVAGRTRNIDYAFPIMYAVVGGNASIVELLIENGADIHFKGKGERNPLIVAADRGRIDVIEVLLKHGADIETSGEGYTTPMNTATLYGNKEAVLYLLSKGADPQRACHSGWTPFDNAIRRQKVELVKAMLAAGAWSRSVAGRASRAMVLAASTRTPEILELLLDHGEDIEVPDDNGATSLMRAAAMDRVALVEFLIQRGANIHARDRIGRTALTYTALGEYTGNSLRLLLDHGADIESCDSSSVTPLMVAVQGGRVTSTKILLYDRGANPNCVVGNGITPLWWVVEQPPTRAYLSVMADLLENGADANVVCEGTKPLQRAVERGFRVSVELLLRAAGFKIDYEREAHAQDFGSVYTIAVNGKPMGSDYTGPVNGMQDANRVMFSTNFSFGMRGMPSSIGFTAMWKDQTACKSRIQVNQCRFHLATVNYPVHIVNGIVDRWALYSDLNKFLPIVGHRNIRYGKVKYRDGRFIFPDEEVQGEDLQRRLELNHTHWTSTPRSGTQYV
ncbi:hypothetical protein MW887_004821 [Aspergillus wentii]|nr:hypothetical protein MW887_004821 [Aspergillus wentii]